MSKAKVLNRAIKFGNSSQETKTVEGMMGIYTKKLRFSINTYWLGEKILNTATITNLLIRDKNKEVIKTCKSESLKTFQEKFEDMLSKMWSAIEGFMGVLFHSSSTIKEEDSDCSDTASIKIPDYKAGEKSLEDLHEKVMTAEYLKNFKKVISFHWFRLWLPIFFV